MLSGTLSAPASASSIQEEREVKSHTVEPPIDVSYDETFLYFNEEIALHAKLYEKGIISLNSPPIDSESMAHTAAKVTNNTIKMGSEVFRIDSRPVLEAEVAGAREVIAASDALIQDLESVARMDEPRWGVLLSLLTESFNNIEKNMFEYYRSELRDDDSVSSDDGEYQLHNAYQTVRSILTIVSHCLGDDTDNLSLIYKMSRRINPDLTRKTKAVPFFPFVMDANTSGTGYSDNIALRISPSVFMRDDNRVLYQALPFDIFCFKASMFGMGLVGIMRNGSKIPLLNFHIDLPTGQDIVDVECSSSLFFEELQFQTIRTIGLMMKRLGSLTPKAMCQVQCVEYAIFGFNLYFAKKMTFAALEKLVEMIELREVAILNRLEALFKELQAELFVFSPFENLLGQVDKDQNGSKVRPIISLLNLSDLTPADTRTNETYLIGQCLVALTKNMINPLHAYIWKDFITTMNDRLYHSLAMEEFIKISNVVAYAIALHGMRPFAVCFIQLCSEMGMQNLTNIYFNQSNYVFEPSMTISVFDPCLAHEEGQASEMKQDVTGFHFKDNGEKKSGYLLMTHACFFQQSLRNAANVVPESAVAALNIKRDEMRNRNPVRR